MNEEHEELASRLFILADQKHIGTVVRCELCERWAQEREDIEHDDDCAAPAIIATIRKLSRELLDARLAATHNAECAEGLSRELEEAKEQWIAYQGRFERAGWELTKLKGELEEARGERDDEKAGKLAMFDQYETLVAELKARVEVLEAALREICEGEQDPHVIAGRALSTPTPPEGAEPRELHADDIGADPFNGA